MRILKGVEIPIAICISYTILSVSNAVLSLCSGYETVGHWNSIIMLMWTSIAVLILSIHHLFDNFSPVVMIVIQYVIAMGLVLLTVYVSGFFDEISETGYRDAVRSFTIPYIIGALFYYVSVFQTANKQNKLLQEIKDKKQCQ